jgi:hypothetical protein
MTEPGIAVPKPQCRWYQCSLRKAMLSVLVRAFPCSWLAAKQTLTNLVWAVVGLIFGRCVGHFCAYSMGGQDQLVLHAEGGLEACVLVDMFCGAVIGLLLGYTVALGREAMPSDTPPRSGIRRLLDEPEIWVLLLFVGLVLYMLSPFPAARE